MNNPLHFFFHAAPSPGAANAEARASARPASTGDHPTPETVGLEIGAILAVTLGLAYAVSLALSACGID
jgi:hypothetical protein